jgi:hypothetical protein
MTSRLLYVKIWHMFLKRKIICALDKYEDIELEGKEMAYLAKNKRQLGITQRAFIAWFREKNGNDKYTYETVDKCINDCIEDNYIRRVYVNGDAYMRFVPNEDGPTFLAKTKLPYYQIENISVSSKGRELKHWYFFYLKFLPENFSDLKVVLVTVLVTIFTSPLWNPLFSIIKNKLEFWLYKLL